MLTGFIKKMNTSRTIKYKALFLLLSFSLNTVVGFACSLGIDMGFNSGHHHHEHNDEEQDKNSHSHSDGDGSSHRGKHNYSHTYAEAQKHTPGLENTFTIKASEDDENCCKDFVIGFQSLDKQLTQKSNITKFKIGVTPFFLHTTLPFKNTDYIEPIRTPPKIPDYSPPDIRVFIKSFLI